jgi:hypothetical protein
MSQVTHPKVQFGAQLRAHRLLALAALLALLATTVVVLALALSDNQPTTTVSDQPAPAVRGDGGPEETAVAASVGTRSVGRPDESKVAAAIGAAPEPASPAAQASRPDESAVASGISGR